jgi:glycosyltransferase involved in cell wall biosynthesis
MVDFDDSDFKKIILNKNGGPIVFLGGMNAMPMMYAIELRKKGYDVLYLVDVPISNTLSRPENHFAEIKYPYPQWIIEFPLRTQIFLPLLRKFYAKKIMNCISNIRDKHPQVYFLNGFFFSLAPFLNQESNKISLSHGSDLDSWCDVKGANELSKNFKKQSIFKFMPKLVVSKLIKLIVNRQYLGLENSNVIIYFPKGFNSNGDRVLRSLKEKGIKSLGRYDISFEPLKQTPRKFKENSQNGKLVLLSCVRFTFKTFTEGNIDYNKGNDLIIYGISKFYKENPNIEIHFVEKGPDVNEAKRICTQEGLDPVVVWHKEMTLFELLKLYQMSDICFDQVGSHWMGAIGAYALWLGKPLITNCDLPVKVDWWPKVNPICEAANSEQVYQQLIKLSDNGYRKHISDESKVFADKFLSPAQLLHSLFNVSEEFS